MSCYRETFKMMLWVSLLLVSQAKGFVPPSSLPSIVSTLVATNTPMNPATTTTRNEAAEDTTLGATTTSIIDVGESVGTHEDDSLGDAISTNQEPDDALAFQTNDTETDVSISDIQDDLDNNHNSSSLSPEYEAFLEDALTQNVLFADLPQESLQALIHAFEWAEFNRTDRLQRDIIRQGERNETDFVYVLYQGECNVERDGKLVPRPYGVLRRRAIFGEFDVLYNRTSAVTISCKTPTVQAFRIPCETFKEILNQQQQPDAGSPTENVQALDAKIESVIQEVEGTKSLYGGNIIQPYKPDRIWLWSRLRGTVLQHAAKPTLLNMLWAAGFCLLAQTREPPFLAKLQMVHQIWTYQQGLTIFILTFFLNQAYSFWREIYTLGRQIQGRLNDIHLILATTAARKKPRERNSSTIYTPAAETCLDDIGQFSRLFHALFWASVTRRYEILQTKRGLERMASRGIITYKQLQALLDMDLPENQRHSAVLEWMMIRADQAMTDGTFVSDPAHRQYIISKICDLRTTCAAISDKIAGRMPLCYTHLVTILVDSFVWAAPLALFSELGTWSVLCVGVLTLFYSGLMDLAKIFLDPLDNEDFYPNSIDMDLGVLIRESNAGSTRWKRGAARLPF